MTQHTDHDITDRGADCDTGAATQPRPAPPGSALGSLRDRRRKAVDALFLDLAVPRYDPPVFVRYKPLTDARMAAINDRFSKAAKKDPEANLRANATALADACVGVFEVTADGQEVSVDPDDRGGDWPRFDDRLGALLGLEGTTSALQVIRTLYLTDADVNATSAKLAEWSGYNLEAVEERETGN